MFHTDEVQHIIKNTTWKTEESHSTKLEETGFLIIQKIYLSVTNEYIDFVDEYTLFHYYFVLFCKLALLVWMTFWKTAYNNIIDVEYEVTSINTIIIG